MQPEEGECLGPLCAPCKGCIDVRPRRREPFHVVTWPHDSYVRRDLTARYARGQFWGRSRVQGKDELGIACPSLRSMFLPVSLESIQGSAYIAGPNDVRASLDLHIDVAVRVLQLDVFIELDKHATPAPRRRHQQAGDAVQVLIEEAAVQHLDPTQLCRVDHGCSQSFFLHRTSLDHHASSFLWLHDDAGSHKHHCSGWKPPGGVTQA